MGMPCEINSILKLKRSQGYPVALTAGNFHSVEKDGYRIFPLDVPLQLVDEDWLAHADVVIEKLTWKGRKTLLEFRVSRVYEAAFSVQ